MAPRRAIAAACIAACVCVATFAVLSSDSAMPGEIIAEGVDASHEVDVLKNLIHLKAYCLAAWDDSRVIAEAAKGKYGAINDFVVSYGQEGSGVARGGRSAKIGNIVMEYAGIMGALRIKYPKGVNKYILDSIDHAVRHDLNGAVFEKHDLNAFGSGGINGRKYGHLVAWRNKALGLVDRPNIVVQLAAKYADYLHYKTVASSQADNADAIAATMFLKSKGAGRYQSFLQREVAKVERKMRHDFGVIAKKAYGAEEDAFEESYQADQEAYFAHANVQAPAGVTAADQAAAGIKWVPPSMEQMKAIAAKHAKTFLEEFKKKNPTPAKLIKSMVDEAGGVKLFVTTSGETDAQSTMKPKIEFVGKEKSMSGVIRSVPGKSLTFVQHFGTEHPIGKIQKVVLTGTGSGLKWDVSSLKVRVGNKDATVVKMITGKPDGNFWLKSGETVELTPDPDSFNKAEFTKQGCMGWRATSQCDPDGDREEDDDKGCTDEIDSSMSGFCKCDTGVVARVECGHATFTCDEMCKE